ncbi:MAG: signal transduction histidine kinase [Rickettsiales bacterium]|jgi:signal transduction histidine kinase
MTNKNFITNLQQINQLKSLAGSIAHETRNPLSAINSACEIVRKNLEEAMEFLDLMSSSSSKGLVISEIILNNIKTGEIDKSKFVNLSISETVDEAIAKYIFEGEKEISLLNIDLKDDFNFLGDETLMSFAILNLLKNALFYKAKIEIWLNSKTNSLHFKDYGVGIPKDKLPHIFDDFFTSNKKGGTGLGLPFCKRVMTAFGGDIFVKSELGKWTEFELKFPNLDKI